MIPIRNPKVAAAKIFRQNSAWQLHSPLSDHHKLNLYQPRKCNKKVKTKYLEDYKNKSLRLICED